MNKPITVPDKELGLNPAPERFDVKVGSTIVPFHLIQREGATKLVIFANGAIDPTQGKDFREIFQRRTWAEGIKAHCLFFSDETTDKHKNIRIGWGQGSEEEFFLAAVSEAVGGVAERIGVNEAGSRTYFGSSAGGFQALILGAMDAGSNVFVNNPQTVWTEYEYDTPVQRILDSVYGGKTREEVLDAFPERVSVSRAFLHYQHVPNIEYLVNAASKPDIDIALPGLLRDLGSLGGLMKDELLSVHYYWNMKLQHNPLHKGPTVEYLNRFLESIST